MIPDFLKHPERVITLDFESFFDSEYSLSSKTMNMSEYVRDPRFKVHCVGIKIGEAPTYVVPGYLAAEELRKLPWESSALLSHNTSFDGLILSHQYGLIPWMYLDSLSMSRGTSAANLSNALGDAATRAGLGGKIPQVLTSVAGISTLTPALAQALEEYCARDVDLTWELFKKIYVLINDHELELIDITVRMFCDPILRLDESMVNEAIVSSLGAKSDLLNNVKATVKELRSDTSFAALLTSAGVDPPRKKNSAGEEAFAFAKSDTHFKDLLQHPNKRVADLMAARLAIKSSIGETRAARLLKAGEGGLKIPVLLNYCGAHTTRWSGGNKLNLQNLPKGGPLRAALMAPEGSVLCVGDSKQIEPRLLLWLANETSLLGSFRSGDPYVDMAKRVFVRSEEISPVQRFIGKVCVIGLGYGMGHAKLQKTLASGIHGPVVSMSTQECKDIVYAYRSQMTAVTELWKELENELACMNKEENKRVMKCLEFKYRRIKLPNELYLHYPNLDFSENGITYSTREGFAFIYGGLLAENIIQALARCVVGEQIRLISKRYRVVTMSHDEIVWVAPKSEADEALKFGFDIMTTAPSWCPDLPLGVTGQYGERYTK